MVEAQPDRFHLYHQPDDPDAPLLGLIFLSFGVGLFYQAANQVMVQRVLALGQPGMESWELSSPASLIWRERWFRPVVQTVGPDGALWIADWYDKYPCYQNAQADPEGVDRERGRIWRVVYTGKDKGKKMGSRPDAKLDLAKSKDQELIKLLDHPNAWQRRVAQRVLRERIWKDKFPEPGQGHTALLNVMDSGFGFRFWFKE